MDHTATDTTHPNALEIATKDAERAAYTKRSDELRVKYERQETYRIAIVGILILAAVIAILVAIVIGTDNGHTNESQEVVACIDKASTPAEATICRMDSGA